VYTTIALQYSVLFSGLAWGRTAREFPGKLLTVWLIPASLSLIMLGVASCKRNRNQGVEKARASSWLLVALIAYDVITITLDPFRKASDEVSCLLAVVWIVIPLLGLRALVRRQAWWAVCGVVLFQATAIASLCFNFPALRKRIGYFVMEVA
jgi:hypothetical protein